MTASGEAVTPAGAVIGQTSTHLPHRVHASAIARARSESAVSNAVAIEKSWQNGNLRAF
jgi:hypothetical protein